MREFHIGRCYQFTQPFPTPSQHVCLIGCWSSDLFVNMGRMVLVLRIPMPPHATRQAVPQHYSASSLCIQSNAKFGASTRVSFWRSSPTPFHPPSFTNLTGYLLFHSFRRRIDEQRQRRCRRRRRRRAPTDSATPPLSLGRPTFRCYALSNSRPSPPPPPRPSLPLSLAPPAPPSVFPRLDRRDRRDRRDLHSGGERESEGRTNFYGNRRPRRLGCGRQPNQRRRSLRRLSTQSQSPPPPLQGECNMYPLHQGGPRIKDIDQKGEDFGRSAFISKEETSRRGRGARGGPNMEKDRDLAGK